MFNYVGYVSGFEVVDSFFMLEIAHNALNIELRLSNSAFRFVDWRDYQYMDIETDSAYPRSL